MLAFLARRLLAALPVLLIVPVVVFLMLRLTSGDLAAVMAGEAAGSRQIDELSETLGLERPLPVQAAAWLAHLAAGDLGRRLHEDLGVAGAIAQRLGATLSLAALTAAITLAAALPLGVLAARRRGGWLDRGLVGLSMLGRALPAFVLAYLLIWLVALRLGWLPAQGYQRLGEGPGGWLRHLVLPALTLAPLPVAIIARAARAAVLEAFDTASIRTARAMGVSERALLHTHALGEAAVPIARAIGSTVGPLIGGLVVIEAVYGIPGVGRLVVEAMLARDFPTVQGTILLFAIAGVLAGLLVDLACAVLDPRIRDGTSRPESADLPVALAYGMPAEQAWPRLRRNLAVRTGAVVLAALVLVAVFAPWLGTVDPSVYDAANARLAPMAYGQIVTPEGDSVMHRFVLGSDGLGRDIYSAIVYGARASLAVGAGAAIVALLLGAGLGLASALGRRVERVMAPILASFAAIPAVLVAIALVAMWSGTFATFVVAVALPAAPRIARLVHALVAAMRAEPYVEAAVTLGTPGWRSLLRHVLPAAVLPLVVQAMLVAAAAIAVEAIVSFLGIGLPPDVPSWGNVMAEGRALIPASAYAIAVPGLLLTATLLAVQLLRHGLQRTLDPERVTHA